MNRRSIWVFGDYRNYFQVRVTLQILARANELAEEMQADVCAIVFGHEVDEWVGEYIAHGAHKVYVVDDPGLKEYSIDIYTALMEHLVLQYSPDIILAGATSFGREFAPRVAKRLRTGLTSDCVGLDLDTDGNLVQTAPAFGGNLLSRIVTPHTRPVMATVRGGVFHERVHDYQARGEIVSIDLPDNFPKDRIHVISSIPQARQSQKIEDASIVVCGGRGMGSSKRFKNIFRLARLLGAEVGATRPVVYARWAGPGMLVGQADQHISPRVLFSFGISGAIQHTAGIDKSAFIIAVNKNPEAAMMKVADCAIVADANQVCLALIRALEKRLRP
ncbi:MAG: electron transfer flavoprotein subunit alpha/FixB family protein [Thermodesulfobacteriota bacterium]|nr:electron transfer flavoprotein subunit alpha/FixB family protein [Thermodesulfobacteriota bacterium]